MKIYLKDKRFYNEAVHQIKQILPYTVFTCLDEFIEVKKIKPGKIYDSLPVLQNISCIKKIHMDNRELMPLVYSDTDFRFSKPINFAERKVVFIAGPCVIEDENVFYKTADALKSAGVDALRAPIFKPRSSPYGFEGLGLSGLRILKEVKKRTGLPLVTEVLDPRCVEKTSSVSDVIQIGARNMRNYPLLKEAASSKTAVMIKRHPYSSLREWLFSAEYILKYGCKKIIMCERGDKFFGNHSVLNLKMIKQVKKETGLIVIADPSHSSKKREKVFGFSLSAIKSGADGLMIEVSISPEKSRIDTRQIIDIEEFKRIKNAIEKIKI